MHITMVTGSMVENRVPSSPLKLLVLQREISLRTLLTHLQGYLYIKLVQA